MHGLDESTTAGNYLSFARNQARGSSDTLADWAEGVGEDREVLALLDSLPVAKRQPNLLFGAARLVAGVDDLTVGVPYAEFRDAVLSQWESIRAEMLARSTQTNEAGRCATFLPLIASFDGPVALLEVGASAGLCLYPDLYGYEYWVDGGESVALAPVVGNSAVVNRCRISSLSHVLKRLPEVAWRGGIDLNPLDPADPDTRSWLRALVWPEHAERRGRLDAALAVARSHPVDMVKGSLVDEVEAVASRIPHGLRVILFHSAVLAYLSSSDRERFVEAVGRIQVVRPNTVWLSNEGPDVVRPVRERLTDEQRAQVGGRFVMALNGVPVAFTGPHGDSFESLLA